MFWLGLFVGMIVGAAVSMIICTTFRLSSNISHEEEKGEMEKHIDASSK